MSDRTVAVCTKCGQVYAARKHGDRMILSTRDGNCSCGNETVEEIDDEIAAD